jgi:hypothetical protein
MLIIIRQALVFAALLILTAVPSLGAWTELAVSRGPDGFILYVDPLKLPEEHRIVVAFQHLKQFMRPQIHPGSGRLIESLIVEAEYDCHLERERVIKTIAYTEAMGRGTVVAEEAGDSQWRDIPLGDQRGVLWKEACR